MSAKAVVVGHYPIMEYFYKIFKIFLKILTYFRSKKLSIFSRYLHCMCTPKIKVIYLKPTISYDRPKCNPNTNERF